MAVVDSNVVMAEMGRRGDRAANRMAAVMDNKTAATARNVVRVISSGAMVKKDMVGITIISGNQTLRVDSLGPAGIPRPGVAMELLNPVQRVVCPCFGWSRRPIPTSGPIDWSRRLVLSACISPG